MPITTQRAKPKHLRNRVDIIELRERLDRHWYRKKKGAPPVTYAEVYELIRRLEELITTKQTREGKPDGPDAAQT